jgi:hydrogenase nickel incorporation protein HypA/HybF
MHEMALASGMLDIVEAAARAHGAGRVTAVRLEIGALSHVAAEALSFCFDAVTRGTLAEGATLAIETTEGRAWCMPCGTTVGIARRGDACPACGGHQLTVTGGADMRIRDIAIA